MYLNIKDLINQKKGSFEGVLDFYKNDIASISTGRATPLLVEDVVVDAYGQRMHLKELATITAPEPRSLVIQPWDKAVLEAISGAIRKSDIGLNPVVDGPVIRLNIPSLTEERRKEFIKLLKQHVHIPIFTQDETLSSVRAEKELRERKIGYNKESVDALAATYILEDFLREHFQEV